MGPVLLLMFSQGARYPPCDYTMFDPAGGFLSPRPPLADADARRRCQGWPRSGHRRRGLDIGEHGGRLVVAGHRHTDLETPGRQIARASSNLLLCRSTLQAMRASLLASAAASLLRCMRAEAAVSQAPKLNFSHVLGRIRITLAA